MNTILTDDEIADTFKNLLGYFMAPTFDDRKFARAIEAAVLAKLREQEPVAVVKENPHCPEGQSDELSTYLPVGMKLYAAPQPEVIQVPQDHQALARSMADKLMVWKLPENFGPDCFITFDREAAARNPHCWPVGTNLFTHEQAVQMLLDIMPAPLPAVVQVPQGWRTLFADSVEALAKEVDAGWSPEARTQVYRLESAARMMRMELAAPEAPALPADVREALKGLKCVPPKDVASINWRLAYKQGWSAGIDAALARLDALGGGE